MRSRLCVGPCKSVVVLSLGLFCGLAGCGSKSGGGMSASSPAPTAGMSPDEEIAAALAKLPAEEREAATAQKVCPVSEHALGSMGAPYKATVTVDGSSRDVYLCCEGCKDPLEKDPAKYVAKLPK